MAQQVNAAVIKRGAVKGIKTTLELAKIIVPSTIVVTVLKESGVLAEVSAVGAPLMRVFGLSADAALVLISGYFVNLYAAVGSILALNLAPREVAVLAIMLGFAHSLLVEIAVSRRAGTPISAVLPLRVGVSLAAGFIAGRVL